MSLEMESGSQQQQQQQRARQPISVPFLWEEKPGRPKRDWKMYNELLLISVPPPSPARLVISVPFRWEEKPGTPLRLLSKPLLELPPPPPMSESPLPVTSYTNPFIGEEDEGSASGWELEVFASDKPHFRPDLTPLLQIPPSEESPNQLEIWCSFSETDCHSSSGSSIAHNAGTDVSVLDFLFPLSSSNAGYKDKVRFEDEVAPETSSELLSGVHCARDRDLLVKRTLTLGELIPLSRKLSYRRKQMQTDIKKPTFAMKLQDFIQKNLLLCASFGTSTNGHNAAIDSS